MKKRLIALLAAILILAVSVVPCFAGGPTDEILNYIITADVNQDGTVNFLYHIDWKVLETAGIGPLTWVNVGIPHDRFVSIEAVSPNISSIYYSGDWGSNVEVSFVREYGKNDICSFEFRVVMDYMYQINGIEEGKTNYVFIPGWFDDIAVDNLEIHWKKDRAVMAGGDVDFVETEDEIVWKTSLEPGATFEARVYYPNDAYDFDPNKDASDVNKPTPGYNPDHDYYDDSKYDGLYTALGAFVFFGGWYLFLRAVRNAFKKSSGFGTKTTKKITRTKVEYYPVCQGCGSPRPDGATECKYCGRSFIKSEEILKEDEIKEEDKEALKYKTNGEFHYSSSPNTYVRVNVVHVPVTVSTPPRTGSGGGRSHSSSGCAHSSCACACASCACACACACAGGGRAGCTSKDFYNTGLKLRQLELKKYNKNYKDE